MRLARRLIRADRLTPYQAGAALQGKARGLLIGSYLVLDKIAVGGMGVVFKALHQPSRRLVALKILPPSFAQDDDAVRRFHANSPSPAASPTPISSPPSKPAKIAASTS